MGSDRLRAGLKPIRGGLVFGGVVGPCSLRGYGPRAVVHLNRDTATGAIAQPAGVGGCVSHDGSGPCADGHGASM
jgi:hypothetical protein